MSVCLLWREVSLGLLHIFFFFNYLFIYLFLAVLGLHFCARAFSSCGERGLLFIAVRGPLTIAASFVFCTFFDRVVCFLILSCMSCLYVLEINPLLVASFANIFLLDHRWSFHVVYGFLCCAKAFKLN